MTFSIAMSWSIIIHKPIIQQSLPILSKIHFGPLSPANFFPYSNPMIIHFVDKWKSSQQSHRTQWMINDKWHKFFLITTPHANISQHAEWPITTIIWKWTLARYAAVNLFTITESAEEIYRWRSFMPFQGLNFNNFFWLKFVELKWLFIETKLLSF